VIGVEGDVRGKKEMCIIWRLNKVEGRLSSWLIGYCGS
jgi:hypothetical protein